MGNTHDTEIARIEADYIHTRWRTIEDYRWGYTNERGKSVRLSVRLSVGGRGRRGVHRRTAGFIDERGSSTNPASRRTRRRPRTPPTCIIRSLREIEATGNTRPRRQGTCFFLSAVHQRRVVASQLYRRCRSNRSWWKRSLPSCCATLRRSFVTPCTLSVIWRRTIIM